MDITKYKYKRQIVKKVLQGMRAPKKLLHIITGPRQVGKTTAALQIASGWDGSVVHASADLPLPPAPEWIRAQWEYAVSKARRQKEKKAETLLILDEVQKVAGWSEIVKDLWDSEIRENNRLQVILLGSSSLLLQKGLSESLVGRFFLYRCTHWDFKEMEEAFSWDIDQWIFFGGYPGASGFIEQEDVWRQYVTDSLIETVLAKDVLQLQTVAKPALLRHLFLLAAVHPAQILSYNKMLGQLHDAGNTTTLAHYLKLLESAFLVSGLELFKQGRLSKRGSSPKLVLWNNALISAITGESFERCRRDHSWWGRLIENAVGAHLLNHLSGLSYSVYYWRNRGYEVDYVVNTPGAIWALEVKSGKTRNINGFSSFRGLYPEMRTLIIGHQGMDITTFFKTDPKELF